MGQVLAGSGGGEQGPVVQQDRADQTRRGTWRDTVRVTPVQIVPRHTQGWLLVHLQHIEVRYSLGNLKKETSCGVYT